MKTKILILFLGSIFIFGFSDKSNATKSTIDNDEIMENKCIYEVNLKILNESQNSFSYTIAIEWTNVAAVPGAPNYISIRNATRLYYETYFGKSVFSQFIDINHEVWLFNGTSQKTTVEGAISKDDTVETDDGD